MPHYSRPPPIGGWNTVSPLDSMPELDAVVLDNWLPRGGYCETAPGHALQSTYGSTPIQTLAAFEHPTTPVLVGANATAIINAESGVAIKLGMGKGYWQTTMANGRLLMVNGTDAGQAYTAGGGAVDLAFTGAPAGAPFVSLCLFKGRMFYWQANSSTAYYCAAGAYQGAVTALPFDMLASGSLINMFQWTVDGGNGVDDLAVFVFETGDVLVYNGDDPAAASWSLVGKFRIGKPLGYRATAQIGGSHIILTTDGYVDITTLLRSGAVTDLNAYSAKIQTAAQEAAINYTNKQESAALYWPREGLFIALVPLSATSSEQHVRNTVTGAWCRLTAFNARCMAVFNGRMYFGTESGQTRVLQATGQVSPPMTCTAVQAFTACGIVGQAKQLTAVQVNSDCATPALWAVDGMQDSSVVYAMTPVVIATAAATPTNSWLQVSAYGQTITASVRGIPDRRIRWYGTGYLLRAGGVL